MKSQTGSCKKVNNKPDDDLIRSLFMKERLKEFEKNLPDHLKSEWESLSQMEKERAYQEEFYDVS